MIKKIFSVLLCAVLCFALASCGGKQAVDWDKYSSGSTSATFAETESASAPETTVAQTNPSTVTSASATESSAATTSAVITTAVVTTSATETTTAYTTTTAAAPSTMAEATEAAETVSITIDCKTILQNESKLDKAKKDFVPDDGIIFSGNVEIDDGDTAFDALKKACEGNHCNSDCKWCKNGIKLEYTYTPMYKTYYVEGIHQLYEFDCGSTSGWLFSVNGKFPETGSSSYVVKPGDDLLFIYSCEPGDTGYNNG